MKYEGPRPNKIESDPIKTDPIQTYFPFGPPVGYAKLPDELVDDLNMGCDDIIRDKELSESADFSHHLVGLVEQEISIPKEIFSKWSQWFAIQVITFVKGYASQFYLPYGQRSNISKAEIMKEIEKMSINIANAWYVRSFAGDYNPAHTHTNCQLTCVGFLKVPDLSNEIRKVAEGPSGRYRRPGQNGILEIMGNNASDTWENNIMGILPTVGSWYLFPANLRHTVYPFKCEGERRSFSINIKTNVNFPMS